MRGGEAKVACRVANILAVFFTWEAVPVDFCRVLKTARTSAVWHGINRILRRAHQVHHIMIPHFYFHHWKIELILLFRQT